MKNPILDRLRLEIRRPDGSDWYCEHLTQDAEMPFLAFPLPGEDFDSYFCWECFQQRLKQLQPSARVGDSGRRATRRGRGRA